MKKKTMLIVQMLSSYSLAGLLLIISASPSLRASASLSFPNQTEVSGKVTSADDGSPLPGVNVVVKGAPTIGTTTDSRGQFRLSVRDGNDTLVFSYIGYEERMVPLNGHTTVNVQLALSSKRRRDRRNAVLTWCGVPSVKKVV